MEHFGHSIRQTNICLLGRITSARTPQKFKGATSKNGENSDRREFIEDLLHWLSTNTTPNRFLGKIVKAIRR